MPDQTEAEKTLKARKDDLAKAREATPTDTAALEAAKAAVDAAQEAVDQEAA